MPVVGFVHGVLRGRCLLVPEPILESIAAAVAAKSAASLYELVKRKFSGRKDADAALRAADGKSPDASEVSTLAEQLAAAEAADSEFAAQLRREWQRVSANRGGVVNQIAGNVSGKVVQARDIEGGITF
jgi:hypothetical protein